LKEKERRRETLFFFLGLELFFLPFSRVGAEQHRMIMMIFSKSETKCSKNKSAALKPLFEISKGKKKAQKKNKIKIRFAL
jgi:hypothetical protein